MEAPGSAEHVIVSAVPFESQIDPLDSLPPEIRFLHGHIADYASLQQVARRAKDWGTSVEQALFAANLVSPDEYYRALADHAGL